MRIFTVFMMILMFSLSGCEKKADPNAYKLDPILADLNSKADAAAKELEGAKKELEGFKKELQEVKPQTGQIKFAMKRIYDTQAKITRIEQEKRYFQSAAKFREKLAKKLYIEAFKSGSPWPNTKEFEEYKTAEKMRSIKRDWDVKKRFQDAGLPVPGTKPIKKPAAEAAGGKSH